MIELVDSSDIKFFHTEGYLIVENLIPAYDIDYYSALYDAFLENRIDARRYRSDLSGSESEKEKITQIMVPSRLVPELLNNSFHQIS